MELAELILYATPGGAFAEACARYWDAVARNGRPTPAQAFPPHCTLTGFFRRPPERVRSVIEDAGTVAGPGFRVDAATLVRSAGWLGFELVAPQFEAAISRFVSAHRLEPGEDALRPKDWLHLSLAYGDGVEGWHHELATAMFDGVEPGEWSIGLWRRLDAGWRRLDP